MENPTFGQELKRLRKQAGLSQERLVEALDQCARLGATADYRVVDGTLLSRWERARPEDQRQWKPTRAYVLHLIHVLAGQLSLEQACQWAAQAGYRLSPADLQDIFPAPAPQPQFHNTSNTSNTSNTPNPLIATVRHNLPAALTTFVGREAELAAIVRQFSAAEPRLLTLVGEGGVGKTRLALTAAQTFISGESGEATRFRDGVWLVRLAGLDVGSPTGIADQLATAIAQAISFGFGGSDVAPATQLIHFLRTRQMLLVLDNMEHLIAGAPSVVALLQHAPDVRVLVTSRVSLNCQAEQVLKLDGLPTQPPRAPVSFEVPSIKLFAERAGSLAAEGVLNPDTALDVAHLCCLVGGNPLALELAAQWLQHFTVNEMVHALEQQDFSLLTTRQHDVPVRHRSMKAAFETSWQLLPASCQQVLARLSVFRGPFTRQVALRVTDASLSDLVTLYDFSLLYAAPEISGQRTYILHELVRQFAAEKLAMLEPEQTMQRRHADYYLDQIANRAHALYGSATAGVVAEIEAAIDNIRAAWRWAVQNRAVQNQAVTKDHSLPDRLAESWPGLRNFYHVRSRYQEGEEVFRSAAEQLYAEPGLGEALRVTQVFFLNLLHRYDAVAEALQSVFARQDEDEVGDSLRLPVLAMARLEWGITLSLQGRYDAAVNTLTEVVERARRLHLGWVEARAWHMLHRSHIAKGDTAQAEMALQHSLSQYRQMGYQLAEGFVLRSLGYLLFAQGRCTQARTVLEQALHIYQNAADSARVASVWKHLGDVSAAMGDLGRAHNYYRVAYSSGADTQDLRYSANVLEGFGDLLIRLGDYATADQHAHQALQLNRQMGNSISIINDLCILGLVQQRLGHALPALQHYREAVMLGTTTGIDTYAGRAWLGVGIAQAHLRQWDDARVAAEHALTAHRAMGQQQGMLAASIELARIALAQNQLVDALARAEQILEVLTNEDTDDTTEVLSAYWVCYQILHTQQDGRAETVLSSAGELLHRQAASIEEPRLLELFLNQNPVNHEIGVANLNRVGGW